MPFVGVGGTTFVSGRHFLTLLGATTHSCHCARSISVIVTVCASLIVEDPRQTVCANGAFAAPLLSWLWATLKAPQDDEIVGGEDEKSSTDSGIEMAQR